MLSNSSHVAEAAINLSRCSGIGRVTKCPGELHNPIFPYHSLEDTITKFIDGCEYAQVKQWHLLTSQ
jgi:hypothetical protein